MADGETSESSYIDGPSATILTTVASLVDVMKKGNISELDLSFLDVSIRLRGGTGVSTEAPRTVAALPAEIPEEKPTEPAGKIVQAPMVGTFYASPSPQDDPFVQVGDTVRAGQIIGIIEAMKIMNEIPSDADGIVAEIIAVNGQPVEFGSHLIRVVPPGSA